MRVLKTPMEQPVSNHEGSKQSVLGHWLCPKGSVVCAMGGYVFLFGFWVLACSPTPVALKAEKETYILEGKGAADKIIVNLLDRENQPVTDPARIVFFSENLKVFRLSADGSILALSSGEGSVDVEVVGTDIKLKVPVRVKIPERINLSHEKLGLWIGQVKENVWAEVRSEKDAFIEGYLPFWKSENPAVCKVEPIVDPARRQSWVKITGVGRGKTRIVASFKDLTESISVSVHKDGDTISADGRITEKAEDKAAGKKKKKKKQK